MNSLKNNVLQTQISSSGVKRKRIYLKQFNFPFNIISEQIISVLKKLKAKMRSTTHNICLCICLSLCICIHKTLSKLTLERCPMS